MNKKLNYVTAIEFLSKYIKKHKRNFIMFYFGWFFEMILSIAMPILFGVMIDEIVYYQNLDTFMKISGVFVLMSLFSCALYFFIYAQHGYLMSIYTFDIKKDIFEHFQKCDAEYLTDMQTGDIIETIQSYPSECMHFVIRNILHMVNGIICIIAITVYLFVISWQIGLFVLIVAPISVTLNAKFGKKIRQYGEEKREYYRGYISWLFEILSALRDIRLLGAQHKTNQTFQENHKKMFNVNIKSSISTLTATNMIALTNLLVQLSIFTFAGFLAMTGNITMGLLTVIITFFAMFKSNISETSTRFLDMQDRISYIQRIYDFLNAPTEANEKRKKELHITDGTITFENIHFSYNKGNVVLDDFNLHISAGERAALIGKSGCGKTTLAYMLIGFYRPTHGEIIIDGQKLSDCSLTSIRQNIGLVAQDVLIFDGSIRDNILLGNKQASGDEVALVCKKAGLWEWLNTLPDHINTIVGKNGLGLSGGQKQRISIARIYLKDPKIIIFDEATSSLDSETEKAIHASWESVLAGRTSIVIAHRLSSVMLCQKAAILEHGRMVELGTPKAMTENSKKFQTLFPIKGGEELA